MNKTGPYNYWIKDQAGNRVFKLPRNIGKECENLGIPAEEIKRNYNEYVSVGMRVTYADGALKAILKKKEEKQKRNNQ